MLFNFIFNNFTIFSTNKLIINSAATRKYCKNKARLVPLSRSSKWQAILKSSMNSQINADSEQKTYEL